MNKNIKVIEEDLMIMPGLGATISIGSDRYAYYVSEVLPNNVIGIYSPESYFDDKHPWEGGDQMVSPYDTNHKSDTYIKRRYGKWWTCTPDGKPINHFTTKWSRLHFGHAISYRDPSF